MAAATAGPWLFARRDRTAAREAVESSPAVAGRVRTVVVATTAEPRSLLPPYAVSLVEGQLCDLLYQRLAEPVAAFSTAGDRDYRPALASSWSWAPDSLSIRFTLDTSARWHDGRPVTSRDVLFTFNLMRDPRTLSPRAPPAAIIDSISAPDPRTAIVWAGRRSVSLFHDVTFPMRVLPAHLLDSISPGSLMTHPLNRAPVGSGPFRFERWTPGSYVELAAADAWHGRLGRPPSGPTVRRALLRVFPSYESAVAATLTGEVDVLDYVRPDDVSRIARAPHLALLRLPGFSYALLQFNLRARPAPPGTLPVGHASPPLFDDPRVRLALAMSVDRAALVGNLLSGAGFVGAGPFTRGQATADTSLSMPSYNPAVAERLLDAAGWRRTPAGAVRRRGGRPLAFTLLVPASSATRVAAAVLLQSMLARVGARVEVERLDPAAMMAALERADFDAALMALRVDPDPAGVRDAWGGEAARTGRGFNYGGYASTVTDALLDSAAQATNASAARAWYSRAYRRIVDDAPAIFLYEPVGLVAYDTRWRPTRVRPDAWWAGLADWSRR